MSTPPNQTGFVKGNILKLPDLDQPFVAQSDASNDTLDACLLQAYGSIKHPVKLLPPEQNYSVGEREALAIIWCVNKFHRFPYGQHFVHLPSKMVIFVPPIKIEEDSQNKTGLLK